MAISHTSFRRRLKLAVCQPESVFPKIIRKFYSQRDRLRLAEREIESESEATLLPLTRAELSFQCFNVIVFTFQFEKASSFFDHEQCLLNTATH